MRPFKTWKWHAIHEGDTKFYKAFLLSCEDAGRFVLIKNWGKKGAAGQLKTEIFESFNSAFSAYNSIIRQKGGRGYSNTLVNEDGVEHEWPDLTAKYPVEMANIKSYSRGTYSQLREVGESTVVEEFEYDSMLTEQERVDKEEKLTAKRQESSEWGSW